MSYNIDTWHTKKLKNFRLPVAALFRDEDYRPATKEPPFVVDESEIDGEIHDGWLHVTSIDISQENSGHVMESWLMPALRESKGLLIACRVWEGGDAIDRITVRDGVITEEEIELA